MKRALFCIITLALATACKQESAPASATTTTSETPGSVDLSQYQLTETTVKGFQKAALIDDKGRLLEEGLVKNGKKTGTWIAYWPEDQTPQRVASFVDGLFNGPYLEYDTYHRITIRAFYVNNKLEGPWTRYEFDRVVVETTYKDGKLDGKYTEYRRSDGQVQKEMNFKDGALDGVYRYYNEQGKVILEYNYRKGEKLGDAKF